jgi:hypothetical protein
VCTVILTFVLQVVEAIQGIIWARRDLFASIGWWKLLRRGLLDEALIALWFRFGVEVGRAWCGAAVVPKLDVAFCT